MQRARRVFVFFLFAWSVAGFLSPAIAESNQEIFDKLPPLQLPVLDPDVLAFGESLRFVSGYAQGDYTLIDGPGDQLDLTMNAAAFYNWRMERERWGYGFTVEGSMDLSSELTEDRKSVSWGVALRSLQMDLRYYVTPGLSVGRKPWQQGYVLLQARADPISYGLHHQSDEDLTEQWGRARALVGVGFGMGRLIDIGPRLRLLKLERMLQDHGLLKGALSKEVGDRILLTWFALRNQLGSHDHLAYTMKVLHEAGLVDGEPSLSAVYEFLAIFDDPQLDGRMLGRDLRFVFQSGYEHARQAFGDHSTNLASFSFLISYNEIFHLDLDAWLELSPSVSFSMTEQDMGGGEKVWSHWSMGLYVPARFMRYFYDEHYNSQGRMRIEPALTYMPFISGFTFDDAFLLSVDFAYDFAFHRGHYYSLGLYASLLTADLFDAERFHVGLTFSYTWGHAAGYFSSYGPVESELGWLPL